MELLAQGIIVGLAGTPHCLGMCGGFALHLARTDESGRRVSSAQWGLLFRQLVYLAGKAFTYAFLGAIAGFIGVVLLQSEWVAGSRKVLAALAGVVMVVFGLQMLGLTPRLKWRGLSVQEWGPVQQLYGYFFRSPGLWAAFVLGLLTGFLPCPMTAMMLIVAAGTHSVPSGMIVMAALGLGTVPGLLAVGLSGGLVAGRIKAVGLRVAGVVLICLGTLTVLRGTEMMHHGHAGHEGTMMMEPTGPIHGADDRL